MKASKVATLVVLAFAVVAWGCFLLMVGALQYAASTKAGW